MRPRPCHFCLRKLTRYQDLKRGSCEDCGKDHDLPLVYVAVCSSCVDRRRHPQQILAQAAMGRTLEMFSVTPSA